MLTELLVRFMVGGLVVTAFAVIGDMLRPKSFAGLFGAAPSVALATLALTLGTRGPKYASLEGRSMLIGAIALFLYTLPVGLVLLKKRDSNPVVVSGASWAVWLVVAFALWKGVLQ